MVKLFIIARNIKEAEEYAKTTIFNKNEWVYIWNENYLRGRQHFIPHVD